MQGQQNLSSFNRTIFVLSLVCTAQRISRTGFVQFHSSLSVRSICQNSGRPDRPGENRIRHCEGMVLQNL